MHVSNVSDHGNVVKVEMDSHVLDVWRKGLAAGKLSIPILSFQSNSPKRPTTALLAVNQNVVPTPTL
jgi:hypothetical protein